MINRLLMLGEQVIAQAEIERRERIAREQEACAKGVVEKRQLRQASG